MLFQPLNPVWDQNGIFMPSTLKISLTTNDVERPQSLEQTMGSVMIFMLWRPDWLVQSSNYEVVLQK